MSTRRSMRETENKLSAAIKPYREYYDFVDVIECDDASDFHPGDVKDGCTFVGHLIAKDATDTDLSMLLVFKDEDDKYIVGSTIGGMIIPISLESALN